MKKGDFVLITGHVNISNDKFKELPICYRYGRIVELKQKFDENTGRKKPLQIIVTRRASDGKKYSSPADKKYIQTLNIK